LTTNLSKFIAQTKPDNMQNKQRSILSGSLLAGVLLAATSIQAEPSRLFRFNDLGSGDHVRSELLAHNGNLELKCSKDSTSTKKTKDGKCGEGKCSGSKKDSTSKSTPKKGGN
jgi:uncharacterized low-complexity protein